MLVHSIASLAADGTYRAVIFYIYLELAFGYLARTAEFGNSIGSWSLVLLISIAFRC